jgi:hypothetical protein
MKYFSLWETDMSRISSDPKEMAESMTKAIEMSKQWLKNHPGAEWGAFIGEHRGYVMADLSATELMEANLMFSPYIHFKNFQAVTINEYEDAFKSTMAKMQKK